MGDVRERFDIIERKVETIERTMATKDDIAKVEARMGSMDSKIDQHGELLREILARLPKTGQ
jgi:tetrahydromethanopterin S-methyltransferase subunit G